MQTKKGLGGLRLLEENMTRRKGGGFLVILGRVLGWGLENFEETGLSGEQPFLLCGGGW